MAGSWLAGFSEDHDEPQEDSAPFPPDKESDTILLCKHCGSDKLMRPRNSSDTDAVRFVCSACNRESAFKLQCGYRSVYVAN